MFIHEISTYVRVEVQNDLIEFSINLIWQIIKSTDTVKHFEQ